MVANIFTFIPLGAENSGETMCSKPVGYHLGTTRYDYCSHSFYKKGNSESNEQGCTRLLTFGVSLTDPISQAKAISERPSEGMPKAVANGPRWGVVSSKIRRSLVGEDGVEEEENPAWLWDDELIFRTHFSSRFERFCDDLKHFISCFEEICCRLNGNASQPSQPKLGLLNIPFERVASKRLVGSCCCAWEDFWPGPGLFLR